MNELAYSIVQYSHEPERQERINVAVITFDLRSLKTHWSGLQSFGRLSTVFGRVNPSFLKASMEEFYERTAFEFTRGDGIKGVQKFRQTRSNNLFLTHPRPVIGASLSDVTKRLFIDAVEARGGGERRTKVGRQLKTVLEQRDVLKRFDRDPEPVSLPRYRAKVRADLAIRKREYTLIEAVRFDDVQGLLKKTGEQAFLGNALNTNLGMRLVVVGDFSGETLELFRTVKEDLQAANTELYRIDQIDPFVERYAA